MKELLQEMLGMKVGTIVKNQRKNGVPTIPEEQLEPLFTKFNGLDRSKLRGVMIITCSDEQGQNGPGVGLETMFAGTQQLMDAMMELQAVRLSMVADDPNVQRIGPGPDDPRPGCGKVHGDPIAELLEAGGGTDPFEFLNDLDPATAGRRRYPPADKTAKLLAALLLGPLNRRR